MSEGIELAMRFRLAPIYSVGLRGSEDRFNTALLPFEISDGLTIEDVEPKLGVDAFELWKRMLGESTYERVGRIKYAIVQRYDSAHPISSSADSTLDFATSCLRLVRPMRENVLTSAEGDLRADGTFDVRSFQLSGQHAGTEVVEAHKLCGLRTRDAEELRELLPEFVAAMTGEFWKFRMAVQFHNLGYFQSLHWKPRFILWTSAIESIFTSHNPDHQGKLVATSRIKWFLGEHTRIYPDSEWGSCVLPSCDLTINDVLDDLYDLRNFVAHGDKVPDQFFTDNPRSGINGGVSRVEVLSESASFIIRTALLKILRGGLLEHFRDARPAERYFGAEGLVNSRLRPSSRIPHN